jgi:hypothetical protein
VKKFYVSFYITLEEDNTILSLCSDTHEDDVQEVIRHIIYDIDDVKIHNLTVKEKT